MASPICEREIESTMSDFSWQRLTGTANGGPSGRQGVPAVRVGWRMRLGMARRVLMDPPYAVPGLHTSPVPGSRETAWALAPQPPVTGIETNEQSQLELIKELDGLWDEVPDAPRSDWRYRSASMFVPGDATVYFALLRYWKPSLLVEVGSGFTSVLALDCSDRYLPDLRRTFIDPHPQRLFGLLSEGDKAKTNILTAPVQEVPLEIFDDLQAGDILFVDTDHFTKAGCEVNWLVFNVFPRLAAGVHIHIHDIFWPFEYPEQWLRDRRGYNELYFFRAFLTDNPSYRVRLMNSWLWHEHRETFTGVRPGETQWSEIGPASLWIDKC